MRRECWKRGEVGEENQAAKRGVIFQRTVGGVSRGWWGWGNGWGEVTGSGGPAGAVGGEDAGGLVDDEVPAGDGEVEGEGFGVDEAEAVGGESVGEEVVCFFFLWGVRGFVDVEEGGWQTFVGSLDLVAKGV